MKKSEFREARTTYWWGKPLGRRADADILADRDVEAAEAAGVVWEPEAVALPRHVKVSWVSTDITKPSRPVLQRSLLADSRDVTRDEALEVVDAYNRLQAGELVESRKAVATYAELREERDRLLKEARGLRESNWSLLDGCERRAKALHRLAKEAGVSNFDGDEAVVDAVLKKIDNAEGMRAKRLARAKQHMENVWPGGFTSLAIATLYRILTEDDEK